MDTVLITGGSGFFANHFVRSLLARDNPPRKISILSRSEYRQFQMNRELCSLDKTGALRFLIGDVRDRDRLRRAMEDIEVVIHAAALKRIEVGHYNPVEMVRTNVDGTINVVEAAKDAGVKKVIYLSSDKAFQPVSPYGLTKALGEQIVLSANHTRGWRGPKYSCCRYGNIWRSTGSVVPVWESMIKVGSKSVPLTDGDCTRFFMRGPEAVDLVLNTIETMPPDKPVIPELPAYRMADLATAMGVATDITGLPGWEKKHESMDFGNSSDVARRMTVDELRYELENTR